MTFHPVFLRRAARNCAGRYLRERTEGGRGRVVVAVLAAIVWPTLPVLAQVSLSNGAVSPTSGTNHTPFQFSVDYSETNDNAPTTAQVTVPGGGTANFTLGAPANRTYTTPPTAFATFTASGTADIYFQSAGVPAPDDDHEYVAMTYRNDPPTLSNFNVDPPSGMSLATNYPPSPSDDPGSETTPNDPGAATTFTWSCTYSDVNWDPPLGVPEIRIFRNGIEYVSWQPMVADTWVGAVNDWSAGRNYTYSQQLAVDASPPNTFTYEIRVTDNPSSGALTITSALQSGPDCYAPAYLHSATMTVDPADPFNYMDGTGSSTYTFRVTYVQADNLPPQAWRDASEDSWNSGSFTSGVVIFIDGQRHFMRKVTAGTNYAAGVVYEYVVRPTDHDGQSSGEQWDNDYVSFGPSGAASLRYGGTTHVVDYFWASPDGRAAYGTAYEPDAGPNDVQLTQYVPDFNDDNDVPFETVDNTFHVHPVLVPALANQTWGFSYTNPAGADPIRTTVDTTITYNVGYWAEDDKMKKISVFIKPPTGNEQEYAMQVPAGGDTTPPISYHDGETFEYKTTLTPGIYSFRFEANDWTRTTNLPLKPDGTTYFTGPWVNNRPELTNGYVSPTSGPSDRKFTYYVTYTDADNDPPQVAQVIIDNNVQAVMTKVDDTDNTYTDGVVYKYEADQLGTGSHTFYFKFRDNWALPGQEATHPRAGEWVTFPSGDVNGNPSTSISGPNVGGVPPILSAPSVTNDPGETDWSAAIDPDDGTPATVFTFSVTYTDYDNDPPAFIKVRILDDNGWTEHQMVEQTTADTVYTDGKVYQYQTRLQTRAGNASHQFQFYASDGVNGNQYPWYSGKVTAIATTTMTDSTQGWGVNALAGRTLLFTSGTAQTKRFTIASNTATTITVAEDLENDEGVQVGDKYVVLLPQETGTNIQPPGNAPTQTTDTDLSPHDGPTVNDNNPPVLENPDNDSLTDTTGTVTPTEGDKSSAFTWRIKYVDTDENDPEAGEPAFIQVYIDGIGHDMIKADSSDLVFSDGVVYTFTQTLTTGGHTYHFECNDGADTARFPKTGEIQNPKVNNRPILTPSAVSPAAGGSTTNFTYQANYLDEDNDAPSTGYPAVLIDPEVFSAKVTAVTGTSLDIDHAMTEHAMQNYYVKLTSGAASDRVFVINDNDSNTLQTDVDFGSLGVKTGDTLEVAGIQQVLPAKPNAGTVTGVTTKDSSNDTITTDQSFDVDAHQNQYLRFLTGGAIGKVFPIASHEAAELTVANVDLAAEGVATGDSFVVETGIAKSLSKINTADNKYDDGVDYRVTVTAGKLIGGNHAFRFVALSQGGGFTQGTMTTTQGGPSVNNSPSLSAGNVSPGDGRLSTTFTYTVKYKDVDDDAPSYIRLHILRDAAEISGSPFDMGKQDTGDNDYDGVGVVYKKDTTLPQTGGTYKYWFEASDGANTIVYPSGADTTDSARLTGPNVNTPPELEEVGAGVSPTTGGQTGADSVFTYTVTYTDADGHLPAAGYPKLYAFEPDGSATSGSPFTMSETDAGDTDPTDGKTYSVQLGPNLSLGTHSFYFEAKDAAPPGAEETVRTPADPNTLSGPTVQQRVPTLTDLTATQIVTSGNTLTISVQYTDLDNDAPSPTNPTVTVKRQSDGTAVVTGQAMVADAGNDGDYTNGETYNYTFTPTGSAAQQHDVYAFYIEASDGSNAVRLPGSSPGLVKDKLNVNEPPTFANAGVAPAAGELNTTFTWSIDFTDTDYAADKDGVLNKTRTVQVTIISPDSTVLETADMVKDPADDDPTDGLTFTYARTLPTAGKYKYYFQASDGWSNGSIRQPAAGSTDGPTVGSGNVPTLTNDSVNPTSGVVETNFTFTVTYTDADNDAPTSIQVVLTDPDGTVTNSDMTAVNTADTDYTDGAQYTLTTTLPKVGDWKYHYTATDGSNTVNLPVSGDNTITINATNRAPTLAGGSVAPVTGTGSTTFTYTVTYTDADNQPPTFVRVVVDSGKATEQTFDLTAADTTDTNYVDGAVYQYTTTAGDLEVGTHQYHFEASDGTDTARFPDPSGELNGPTVTNTAPTLTNAQVNPANPISSENYTFSVTYTDADGDLPAADYPKLYIFDPTGAQVTGSPFTMTETDAGDTDPTDGKEYQYTTTGFVPGLHTYYIVASDGIDSVRVPATGTNPGPQVNYPPEHNDTGTVAPNPGREADAYTFTLTYTDQDNDPPSPAPRLFLKIGANDAVGYTMQEVDPGDTDYTDGKDYQYTFPAGTLKPSATVGGYSYYFIISDGRETARQPASGFTSGPIVNTAPTLTSSVDPDPGVSTRLFTFETTFTDPDGQYGQFDTTPPTVQVIVDGTTYDMVPDATDPDYMADPKLWQNGITYLYTLTDPLAEGGGHTFQFQASDGLDVVTSGPFNGPEVKHAPTLTDQTGALAGVTNTTDIVFKVFYDDSQDDQDGAAYQPTVNVILTDPASGTHTFAMTPEDTTYGDGVAFTKTVNLTNEGIAAEGSWSYRFQATDGGSDATDSPKTDWPRAGLGPAAAQTEPDVFLPAAAPGTAFSVDDAPIVAGATANNTTLTVTFTEQNQMDATAVVDGQYYTLENPTGTSLGTLAGNTGTYDAGTKTVTFVGLALTSLAPDNTFKVTVAAGVTDDSGKGVDQTGGHNEAAGIVADSTPPTVVSCTLNKDTNTAVIVYEENDGMADAAPGSAIDGNNYTLTVNGSASQALNGVVGVLAANTPQTGRHTVTFDLSGLADTNGVYTLAATAVKDAAGNDVDANSNSCTGYIQYQNPAVAGAAAQPDMLTVTFTEDDAMDAATVVDGANYTLDDGGNWAGGSLTGMTGAYDSATKTVTFTGFEAAGKRLTAGNNFIVTVSNAVTDRSGLPVVAPDNTANGVVGPGPLDHVDIADADPTVLTVHESHTFTAKSYDQWNNQRTTDTLTWSLLNAGAGEANEGVGTIDASTGAFTAGSKAGSFTNAVQVQADDGTGTTKTAVVSVTLNPGALAKVVIDNQPVTLAVDEQYQFTAKTYDADDNQRTGDALSWSLLNAGAGESNEGVGTINVGGTSGLFQAGHVAKAFPDAVQVTAGTYTDTATVTVTAGALDHVEIYNTAGDALADDPTVLTVDGTYTFTVKAFDKYDNEKTGVSVQWTVTGGGTIDPQTGEFSAGTVAGTFTNAVHVSTSGPSDTVSVQVDPGALDHVALDTDSVRLQPEAQHQFTATAYDKYGNVRSGHTFTYSLVNAGNGQPNEGVGTINLGGTAGLFQAGTAANIYTDAVQVEVDPSTGVKDTASVTIDAAELDHVVVAPAAVTLALGAPQQFSATAYDKYNNELTGHTFTWSVVNGGGSINSTTGLFTAGKVAGDFPNTVEVTTGGKSDTASVTVQVGALHRVTVTPMSTTLAVGEVQEFEAKAWDKYDNEITGQTFTWSLENGGGTLVGGQDSNGQADPAKATFTAGTAAGTFADTVKVALNDKSVAATVTVEAGPVASVEIDPASVTLTPTATQQFVARAYDQYGNQRGGQTFTWSIDDSVKVGDAAAGTINSVGLFTAGEVAGSYPNAVIATPDGAPGGVEPAKASVTITPGPLNHLVLLTEPDGLLTSPPDSVTVKAGGTQQLYVKAADAWHNEITTGLPTFTWSVVNGGGSISQTGLFTAGTTPGTFPDTARVQSSQDIFDTLSVEVIPGDLDHVEIRDSTDSQTVDAVTLEVDKTYQFHARTYDQYGNPRTGDAVIWSVVNGGGTIDADGLFTAGTTAGTYTGTVKLESGGKSDTATVTVESDGLSTVEVYKSDGSAPADDPTEVSVNGTYTFTAKAFDPHHNEITGQTFTWSVVNGGGSIDSNGVFTAGTVAGTYSGTVQAATGGKTGAVSVKVNPGALYQVKLYQSDGTTPVTDPISVIVAGSYSFVAKAYDQYNNELTGQTFTWSVENGGGSIDGTGKFTAGTVAGTYTNTVQVAAEGKTAQATVTVTADAVDHVTVYQSDGSTPVTAPIELEPADTYAFTAKAFDQYNNEVSGQTFAWSVDPAVGGGAIDAETGVFTAGTTTGTFTDAILATTNGKIGKASVTVNPAAVDHVGIYQDDGTTPVTAPVSVEVDGTYTFTAKAFDKHDNEVSGQSFAWSVDPAVGGGTIDANTGMFTAGTEAGTYTAAVVVSVAGKTDTASVTVTAGAVDHVAVYQDDGTTPVTTPVSVSVGARYTFTAKAFDKYDNEVTGQTFTWSAENGGGSINTSTGEFTAGTVAGTYTDTIQAATAGKIGTASVTLTAGAVDRVAVYESDGTTPVTAPVSIAVNGTYTFTAKAFDQYDNEASGQTFTWAVDPAVGGGTIDANTGVFTAGTQTGTFADTVQVTASGKTGKASVTVTAGAVDHVTVYQSDGATPVTEPVSVTVDDTYTFTAKAFDQYDNELAGQTFVWAVVNGGGTIDAGTGVFTAGTMSGSYTDTVQVTADGKTDTASVTVEPGAVAKVVVTPNPLTVRLPVSGPPAAPSAFTAKAYDAHDNEIANPSVTWSVVNGGGSIDNTGLFTAGTELGTFADTVKATVNGESGSATVVVERAVSLSVGYQLAAMPGTATGVDAAAFFQTNQVARWNGATQQWSTYATQPFTLNPGEGYAVRVTQTTELGVSSVLESPFTLPLAGAPWNLIGNPYLQPLTWDLDAITYSVNGGPAKPLRTLVGDLSRPVEFSAWLLNPATSSWNLLCDPALIPGARSTMNIAEGGWIAARTTGVSLTFPYSTRGRSVPAAVRSRSVSERRWAVKLAPQVEGAITAPAWIGCSDQFGRAGLKLPAPPVLRTDRPYVTVTVSDAQDPSASLAVDLRSSTAGSGRLQWLVTVETDAQGRPVSLTWPDLSELPHTSALRLVDLTSGEVRSLRTATSYTFPAQARGVTRRRFRLELYPAYEGALRVSAMTVAPQLGRGGPGVNITFVISAEADVRLTVRNAAGRVVQTSPIRRSRAGSNTLIWNGRMTTGQPVPRGLYLFELTARDSTGRAVKAVRAAMIH